MSMVLIFLSCFPCDLRHSHDAATSRRKEKIPSVTAKDDVVFDIPANMVMPTTDEGVLMLSVLEMQALLREDSITSVELATMALNMLEIYDPEYNMLEVELRDLILVVAADAGTKFANGAILSGVQGIPFAIKDTYDVSGYYATAYGSEEFIINIRRKSRLFIFIHNSGAETIRVRSLPLQLRRSGTPIHTVSQDYHSYHINVFYGLLLPLLDEEHTIIYYSLFNRRYFKHN